jgi:CubicO group peptidase (beta-lactamase class C family)
MAFQIGINTKVMTATAILQLKEEGKWYYSKSGYSYPGNGH